MRESTKQVFNNADQKKKQKQIDQLKWFSLVLTNEIWNTTQHNYNTLRSC
jgi:hypothetical protein